MTAGAAGFAVAGISGEEILALEELPASAADAVYAAGSAVNGYGNPWSDIDIFAISERSPVGPYAKAAGTNQTSQHYVNGRRVDYEYWHPDAVRRLAERVNGFELGSGQTIQGTAFLYIEECFLHRLRTAVPIANPENVLAFQRLVDFERLSAYQAEDTIRRADALLEDICGMIEVRDGETALFAARELTATAADALLHSRGSTDPVRKWRCRQLAQLGPEEQGWIATFRRLQFPDAARLREDWTQLQRYLEECVGFANATIQRVQQ